MSGCACWHSPVDKASALRLRRVGVAREYLGGSVPAQTYTKRSITGLSFETQRKSRRTRACTLTCNSEQEAQRTCTRAVSNEDILDAYTARSATCGVQAARTSQTQPDQAAGLLACKTGAPVQRLVGTYRADGIAIGGAVIRPTVV